MVIERQTVDAPVVFGRRDVAGLCLLVVLAALLRLFWFSGVYGHDDWSYLFLIRCYENGRFDEVFSGMWGLRFQVWYPVHIWFKIFGASYPGAFIIGFSQGLATIPICWAALRYLGFSAGIAALGCLILVLNPIDWIVSSTLRGDIEISFYGGVLLLLLVLTRRATGRARCGWAAALGLAWGLAALAKDWGLVFGWGLCLVGLADWWSRRRFPWEYMVTLAAFFGVLSVDMALLQHATGNWFHRQKISTDWYASAAAMGGFDHDGSLHWRYLADIFLGRRTDITQTGPWANQYPYLGPYFWIFLISLPSALISKGPVRIVAWFSAGVLMWVQFGSMHWSMYMPYHKEPRYFSMLSVPVAVIAAGMLARVFQARVSKALRLAVAGVLACWSIATFAVVIDNHACYTVWRDYVPALAAWMQEHPRASLWAGATIQNELDLRLGYRFSSQVHAQKGAAGYGSIQDVAFFSQGQKPGDLIAVQTGSSDLADMREVNRAALRHVAIISGRTSSTHLLRYEPVSRTTDGYFLSDEPPAQSSDSYTYPRWNVSYTGGPLRMNDGIITKGILVHSRTDLLYRLDETAGIFTATIGMAESALKGNGSVVFTIFVDDVLKFESQVFKASTPPEKVSLSVAGARELKLVVEDAGDGNAHDHAVWGAPYIRRIR